MKNTFSRFTARRAIAFGASFSLVLGGAAVACGGEGVSADTVSGSAPGASASCTPVPTTRNDEVRLALEPTCKACHSTGSNKPFFSSLEAFENLLAYEPAYVVRGEPDKSALVALLEGRGSGAYSQMPLGGASYAALPADSVKISMVAIKEWIATLPPPDASKFAASPTAPTTRRLRVQELVGALQRTLGYAEVGATDKPGGGPNALWVRDPDEVGTITYANTPAVRTWKALGGGSSLARIPDDADWSPGAVRTVTQLSLEWCGTAVARQDKAFFRDSSPDDKLATSPDKIRKNVAYLHLRFLGEVASKEDVDAFVTDVFAPAEARGSAVAWTEVCAALVRDPRFLTY